MCLKRRRKRDGQTDREWCLKRRRTRDGQTDREWCLRRREKDRQTDRQKVIFKKGRRKTDRQTESGV